MFARIYFTSQPTKDGLLHTCFCGRDILKNWLFITLQNTIYIGFSLVHVLTKEITRDIWGFIWNELKYKSFRVTYSTNIERYSFYAHSTSCWWSIIQTFYWVLCSLALPACAPWWVDQGCSPGRIFFVSGLRCSQLPRHHLLLCSVTKIIRIFKIIWHIIFYEDIYKILKQCSCDCDMGK